MSVERTFRCDHEDCDTHQRTDRTYPPAMVTVFDFESGSERRELHFCCWDHLMLFAAKIEAPQAIL